MRACTVLADDLPSSPAIWPLRQMARKTSPLKGFKRHHPQSAAAKFYDYEAVQSASATPGFLMRLRACSSQAQPTEMTCVALSGHLCLCLNFKKT
jgi:aerobic-type carbon monoxide dehydrogenase small subunit (CoxS/CutS family)